MEPINMIIIYYSDKKLPKRLHSLEADMITIKKVALITAHLNAGIIQMVTV